MSQPTLPIARLLLFRLSLDRSADFRFFHSPTIVGFLHARLGTRPNEGLPRGVRQLAVESGRVHYNGGRYYHFGVALLPGSELSMRGLIERLSKRSVEPTLRDAPLGPHTQLVSVTDLVAGNDVTVKGDAEPLTYGDVCKAAAPISESTVVTIRFDSPLLILRQPVQRRDTFLDDQEFSPAVFLDRVGRAIQVGWPTLEKGATPPDATIRTNNLVRAETYYRGARAEKGGKILPGAAGQVELEFSSPIGQDWAVRLLLAGLHGAGKSTGMGQGRFHVEEAPLHPNWPPPAAETLCERIASEDVLTRAGKALEREAILHGNDNVERIEFLERLSQRLPPLKVQLTLGEYRPSALRVPTLHARDANPLSLALPTAQDRFLQHAAIEALGPALGELLEESSLAHRLGLSRRKTEFRLRRAHAQGFRYVLERGLRSHFDGVDWGMLRRRLMAYLGEQNCVDLLMRWVEGPIRLGDHVVRRTRGLPLGAIISPMLGDICLDYIDAAVEEQGFRLVREAGDFVVLCKSADDVKRTLEFIDGGPAHMRQVPAAVPR